MFNASWDFPGVDQKWQFPFFKPTTRVLHSPEDDQSILIETLRCQPLISEPPLLKRDFHMVLSQNKITPNHAYFVFIQRETREDLDDDGHQEQEPWPWRHRPHPHQTSALRGWNQRLAWGELRSPPTKNKTLFLSLWLWSLQLPCSCRLQSSIISHAFQCVVHSQPKTVLFFALAQSSFVICWNLRYKPFYQSSKTSGILNV